MTTNYSRWVLAAAAAATVMTAPIAAQTTGEKLLITAFAVNMSNIGTGSNAQVQIYVDKWSTEAERELLITTMVEKGPKDLLKTLQVRQEILAVGPHPDHPSHAFPVEKLMFPRAPLRSEF